MTIEIHYLSPRFGPARYVLPSVAPKEIEWQGMFLAVLPFIALREGGLFLVLFIPELALWRSGMLD